MSTLLIGVELRAGPDDLDRADQLHRTIRSLATSHARVLESVWLVTTRSTPAETSELLEPLVGDGRLLVLDVSRSLGSWHGLDSQALWLQERLRLDHRSAGSGEPGRTSTTGRWNPVDLTTMAPHVVGLTPGPDGSVLAYGGDEEGPFLVQAGSTGRSRRLAVPGAGRVTWAAAPEEIAIAVGAGPPRHLVGDAVQGFRAVDAPGDVVRLWPLADDKHTRVVLVRSSGEVVVADPGAGRALAAGPRVPEPASSDVLVAQDGAQTFVAGHLEGMDGTAPQLWTTDLTTWQRITLDPPPDQLTDLHRGVLVAGHRALRPTLHDETGSEVAAPDVPLDPTHPRVVVVGRQGEDVVLALQAAETGPQLWVGHDDRWRVELLMPGRLTDACLTDASHVWVLLDGERLWHCADPWPSQRSRS